MWRVSRKTNSASQHTAPFVSAAFIGICRANTGLKAAFQLFLLCQIAGIVCLILKEVFNRNLSVARVVVLCELRFFPAAICSNVGGHFTFLEPFLLTLPLFETLQPSD